MEELVVYYKLKQNPDEKVSPNLASTITTIIDALVELLKRDNTSIDKITVKDIAAKSGYSRTTFYIHFYDVYHVLRTLEDMLLYHLDLNSEVYYLLFLDRLQNNVVKEVYDMLNHYGKYITLLLARDSGFSQQYKEKFISVMTNTSEVKNSGDIRMMYYSSVCASAMIESYLFWLKHKEKISYDIIVKTSNKIATATVYSDESMW